MSPIATYGMGIIFPTMMNFREALIFWQQKREVSLRAIAEGAGVSYEQLKKVKQIDTRATNFDDGVKVAHFFRLTTEEFLAGEAASSPDALVRALEALSPQAREVLENAAYAQLASEQEKSGRSKVADRLPRE